MSGSREPNGGSFCKDLANRLIGVLGLAEHRVGSWKAVCEQKGDSQLIRAENTETAALAILHLYEDELTIALTHPNHDDFITKFKLDRPVEVELEPWVKENLEELHHTFLAN